jgi:hypothetical protein
MLNLGLEIKQVQVLEDIINKMESNNTHLFSKRSNFKKTMEKTKKLMAGKVKIGLFLLSMMYILILISGINALSSLCYQENANASTVGDGNCGLNYSGNYSSSGTWTDIENAYDKNWNTYASSTLGYAYIYINYTKPINSNSAKWQIKDTHVTENLTIPSDCFSQNIIQLRIYNEDPSLEYNNYYCRNSTDWHKLDYTWAWTVYEESIIWNIVNIGITWNKIYTYDNYSDGSVNWTLWQNESSIQGVGTVQEGSNKIGVYAYSGVTGLFTTYINLSTLLLPSNNLIENLTLTTIMDGIHVNYGYAQLFAYGVEIKKFYSGTGVNADTDQWTFKRNYSSNKISVYNYTTFITEITPTDNQLVFKSYAHEDTGSRVVIFNISQINFTYSNYSMNIILNSPLNVSYLNYNLNQTFNITSSISYNTLINSTLYIDNTTIEIKSISGTSNTTTFSRNRSCYNLNM